MIRNLKALLVAAMAVLALGAVWASAAPAAFTAPGGVGTTTLESDIDGAANSKAAHHVFDVPENGPITCNTGEFHSSITGSSANVINVTPTFPNGQCTFLGQPATVNMNGCTFTFQRTPGRSVTVDCPAGKEITFEAAGCTVHVPAQGPLAGINYANISATQVTVSAVVTEITANATGAGCVHPTQFHNATYTTGNTIITGKRGGVNVEVKVD